MIVYQLDGSSATPPLGELANIFPQGWRINHIVKVSGVMYYVLQDWNYHKLPINNTATAIVRKICYGITCLVERGKELP